MFTSEKYINSISKSDCGCCSDNLPLCEHVQFLSEGLGNALKVIGEFLTRYRPNDRRLFVMEEAYTRALHKCEEMHTSRTGGKLKTKNPWDKNNEEIEIDYEDYQENPEFQRCIIDVSIQYIEQTLKYIKETGPEKLCSKNIKKEKCFDKVEDMTIELEEELKNLKILWKNLPNQTKRNKKVGLQFFKKLVK